MKHISTIGIALYSVFLFSFLKADTYTVEVGVKNITVNKKVISSINSPSVTSIRETKKAFRYNESKVFSDANRIVFCDANGKNFLIIDKFIIQCDVLKNGNEDPISNKYYSLDLSLLKLTATNKFVIKYDPKKKQEQEDQSNNSQDLTEKNNSGVQQGQSNASQDKTEEQKTKLRIKQSIISKKLISKKLNFHIFGLNFINITWKMSLPI